jgi:wyosine [tRNA(Phe)-imidazoG37] synthetase (radical SAM superfamily)
MGIEADGYHAVEALKYDPALLTFGPVPSRRLGRSLGVNNIPPKFCSYSCLYCQVGRTLQKEVKPREYYRPEQIIEAVSNKVSAVRDAGEQIDFLTFVPDGEPTLDIRLGETIDLLRPLGIRIAVISNASLIWREEVQTVLHKTNLVSLKVDTVDDKIWANINRPHADLELSNILDGIRRFSKQYQGKLVTETMLLAGINDSQAAVSGVANFLAEIQPATAYLAIPTRPTAEHGIAPPDEQTIVQAYSIFRRQLENVEYLIGYEGSEFSYSGDLEQDLLSITAVHPMREEAVDEMLRKAGKQRDFIQTLLQDQKLKKVEFAGNSFYVRNLSSD